MPLPQPEPADRIPFDWGDSRSWEPVVVMQQPSQPPRIIATADEVEALRERIASLEARIKALEDAHLGGLVW